MAQKYKHTQIGHTLILVYCVMILALLVLSVTIAFPSFTLVGLLFLLIALPTFATLTVTVDSRELQLRFGFGLIRKRIPLAQIAAVQSVENPWWYLLGVRYTPRGWLYAVSGQSAVELQMKDGRTMRIGTDEPARLLAALASAVAAQ